MPPLKEMSSDKQVSHVVTGERLIFFIFICPDRRLVSGQTAFGLRARIKLFLLHAIRVVFVNFC